MLPTFNLLLICTWLSINKICMSWEHLFEKWMFTYQWNIILNITAGKNVVALIHPYDLPYMFVDYLDRLLYFSTKKCVSTREFYHGWIKPLRKILSLKCICKGTELFCQVNLLEALLLTGLIFYSSRLSGITPATKLFKLCWHIVSLKDYH